MPDGAKIHLLGKGVKARTVRVSAETLALFEALGRTAAEDYVFPSPKRNGPWTRQAIAVRMAKWGKLAGVRVHQHKLRHTHPTTASGALQCIHLSKHLGSQYFRYYKRLCCS